MGPVAGESAAQPGPLLAPVRLRSFLQSPARSLRGVTKPRLSCGQVFFPTCSRPHRAGHVSGKDCPSALGFGDFQITCRMQT